VQVRAAAAQRGAILEVHNRGTVPAAVLPNVFEPFRQAGDGAGGGIGLGLYISREIVRAHGGEIAIRSTAADGTTVEVRLLPHAE
jgi:signal transduction histidine kinase